MGKEKNKKSRRRVKSSFEGNFCPEAGPGCHIARKDLPQQWVLDWESVDPSDFDEPIPDIAVDPEEKTLSLCNVRNEHVIAYITVYDIDLVDGNGYVLQKGSTTNNKGSTQVCTTIIVLCPPLTFAHLCFIEYTDFESLQLDSDVQVWDQHQNPSDMHETAIGFPLKGGPFLCTQGHQGELTHFFAGNLHAIDFRCDVGTPLLAVGDGEVVEAKIDNTLTGIAVSNLFEWNSILLQLDTSTDGPLFVEYVHIAQSYVKAGERVSKGQVIGTSGSVGFSPEPHLHFCAYRSSESTAPTVGIHFQGDCSLFLPKASHWYNKNGLVESHMLESSCTAD